MTEGLVARLEASGNGWHRNMTTGADMREAATTITAQAARIAELEEQVATLSRRPLWGQQ